MIVIGDVVALLVWLLLVGTVGWVWRLDRQARADQASIDRFAQARAVLEEGDHRG